MIFINLKALDYSLIKFILILIIVFNFQAQFLEFIYLVFILYLNMIQVLLNYSF